MTDKPKTLDEAFGDPRCWTINTSTVDMAKFRVPSEYFGGNPIERGQHKDEGKPALELIDPYFLEQMGHALAFGATKYSPNNWRKGIEYTRLVGSAMRHIAAFNRKEDNDPESGLPHLAHAACCIMMLLGMTKIHPEMDNRWEDKK